MYIYRGFLVQNTKNSLSIETYNVRFPGHTPFCMASILATHLHAQQKVDILDILLFHDCAKWSFIFHHIPKSCQYNNNLWCYKTYKDTCFDVRTNFELDYRETRLPWLLFNKVNRVWLTLPIENHKLKTLYDGI